MFRLDSRRSLGAEKLGKTISKWITAKLWLLPKVAGSSRDQNTQSLRQAEIIMVVTPTKNKQLMNTINLLLETFRNQTH